MLDEEYFQAGIGEVERGAHTANAAANYQGGGYGLIAITGLGSHDAFLNLLIPEDGDIF
jgi:hypothetical protein